MNSSELGTHTQAGPDIRWLDRLIIALTAGAVLGLIWIAQGNMSRTADNRPFVHPMHSPNDRSRFVTIRALGDNGTYVIGRIADDGTVEPGSLILEQGWDTIDKVRRPADGSVFSSKPPLLPTLLAGEYRLIKLLSGRRLTFADHPHAVVRTIVATANLLPMVAFLILFSRMLDRLTSDAWTHAFAMAAAAGATYLTGFSVTLNNHTVAAYSAFFALYPAWQIWCDGRREAWLFGLSGFFAGFAAVTEFPATALAVALLLGLLSRSSTRTLAVFVPLAALPAIAHFCANYAATGTLRPAYANKEWYEFSGSYWKIDPDSGRLVGTKKDPDTGQTVIDRTGIDSQFEPWYVYAFHLLLGHHGILSLSPIFIFSLVGVWRGLHSRASPGREMAILVAGLTVVLLVFYTVGPGFGVGQRNYGGMCNGLRWLFWLIPLWLVTLPAGLEWKASCRGYRWLALACLVVSAASAFYATRNPWTRPWLHELLHRAGWIAY